MQSLSHTIRIIWEIRSGGHSRSPLQDHCPILSWRFSLGSHYSSCLRVLWPGFSTLLSMQMSCSACSILCQSRRSMGQKFCLRFSLQVRYALDKYSNNLVFWSLSSSSWPLRIFWHRLFSFLWICLWVGEWGFSPWQLSTYIVYSSHYTSFLVSAVPHPDFRYPGTLQIEWEGSSPFFFGKAGKRSRQLSNYRTGLSKAVFLFTTNNEQLTINKQRRC